MQNGDALIFKVYSDWSIKKLFKMFLDPEKPYYESLIELRNRLIHRRQNVGKIYVVHQYRFGLSVEMFHDGIGPKGYQDNKGKSPKHIDLDEMEYITKIVNRNNPTKASWFKIRK